MKNCLTCGKCKLTHKKDFSDLKLECEEFIYNKEKMTPYNAVVNLTDECPLACKYCFVKQRPRKMSYDTLQQVCKFLLKNAKRRPGIGLFGGEPLLEYENIQKIIKEYNKDISFTLTTNGVLLDEEKLVFFLRNNVSILLSLDGDQITQDRQRPYHDLTGSFKDIEKNILLYTALHDNSTMRATLTQESIPEMYKNYLFSKDYGFTCCTFILNQQLTSINKTIYHEQLDLLGLDYYKQIRDHKLKTDPLFLTQAIQRYNGGKAFNNSLIRCGFGTTSCGITTDGRINVCQELSSDDEALIIGDVWNGIDENKHKTFLRAAFDSYTKLSCPQQKICPLELKSFCASCLCPTLMSWHDWVIPKPICSMNSILFEVVKKLSLLVSNSIYPGVTNE